MNIFVQVVNEEAPTLLLSGEKKNYGKQPISIRTAKRLKASAVYTTETMKFTIKSIGLCTKERNHTIFIA